MHLIEQLQLFSALYQSSLDNLQSIFAYIISGVQRVDSTLERHQLNAFSTKGDPAITRRHAARVNALASPKSANSKAKPREIRFLPL